jgi:hypothetical protein
MDLSVKLNNKYQTAKAVFAEKGDLAFVHDWRKTLGDDANPRRNDAVDFAEVAVHRFEAHSAIEPYARAIEDIGDHIQNNPQCEVACLVSIAGEASQSGSRKSQSHPCGANAETHLKL